MPSSTRILLSLVLITPPCLAQVEAAQHKIQAAAQLLSKGQKQAASLELQNAHWLLYGLDAKTRRAQGKMIRQLASLMVKADRQGMRLLRVQTKYVDAVLPLIQRYQQDGSLATAARLQAGLRQISPLLVPAASASVRAGSPHALRHWFGKPYIPYADKWTIEDGRIIGPLRPAAEEAKVSFSLLYGDRVTKGDFDLQIEVDLSKVLRGGIAIGARRLPGDHPKEMVLLELSSETGSLNIQHYQDYKFRYVNGKIITPPYRQGSVKLRVEVRGRKLRCVFGPKNQVFEYTMPIDADGTLALYQSMSAARPGPLQVRGFRLDPVR